MIPVDLRSERLVLDQPVASDTLAIFGHCQDPIFEHFMTLPWPYRESDATYFVETYVPKGWADDSEFTWALRGASGGDLLGVIGYRSERGDIGYWLGGQHRGEGLMPEALRTVADWLFARGVESIAWECVVGNSASAAVARKTGFTFTGARQSEIAMRDGSRPDAWHGALSATDDRGPKPGWPA